MIAMIKWTEIFKDLGGYYNKSCHILIIVVALLSIGAHSSYGQVLEKEVNFSQGRMLPFYSFKKLINTTIFQGNRKRSNYFEGWYFKMVSQDGSQILSVIPGISLSNDGTKQHAFIQLIIGKTGETSYYSFPIEEFYFSKKRFEIRIGNNFFSQDKIILNLKDSFSVVYGEVAMSNNVKYKSNRLLNPGIMGWYRFVPYMECYHGVVSLTNNLKGKLILNEEVYNFENGKGYIEKDWGSSMPSSWIWIQSNHFSAPNSSFMLSIADVPWRKKSFTGFLGFFYHDSKMYHFATYRRSKLQLQVIDQNTVLFKIKNRKHSFEILAVSQNAGLLQAPVAGSMDRRIAESVDALLSISVWDKKGNVIYADSTNIAGLEMVGDYGQLEGTIK